MTIERKVGMGIAGQPSGGATGVEVFSTHLYTGTGAAQTITNGVDLDGEGGMIWTKQRSSTGRPAIVDTERGNTKYLKTDVNGTQDTSTDSITAFNSNGYDIGDDTGSGDKFNTNNVTHVSWTFRKKEKFFDVVTWTGNNVAGREISHGLNGPVGMMVIKSTNNSYHWLVWHKGSNGGDSYQYLNLTNGANNNGKAFFSGNAYTGTYIAPTDSVFTVTNSDEVNASGATYVAYLFADNSAENAEDQMIKCGSYTGDANVTQAIDLGWEPQFVLIKNATSSSNWYMLDTMRGWHVNGDYGGDPTLFADDSGIEGNQIAGEPTATGFNAINDGINLSGKTYIYMAIRAPMMVEPEAATDVFAVESYTGDGGTRTLDAEFGPVDMAIAVRSEDATKLYNLLTTRLTHAELSTNSSAAESSTNFVNLDSNSLVVPASYYSNASGIPYALWAWKRAKGFMDVVAYTGSTSNSTVVKHSLGVVPELIITKRRDGATHWRVWSSYFSSGGGTGKARLNSDAEWYQGDGSLYSVPTSTEITQGTENTGNFIAYLFATLAGISKVGSYTGNGSSQTISCGFSAGARFVLIKRADATGHWYIWDSARGIVAGNDPRLILNNTTAQVTTDDSVDPHNSGFIVNQVAATNINVSSGTYFFYAIA